MGELKGLDPPPKVLWVASGLVKGQLQTPATLSLKSREDLWAGLRPQRAEPEPRDLA